MIVNVKSFVSTDTIKKTISYMLYYGRPRQGKPMNWKSVKAELIDLIHDRGIIGMKELLDEERIRDYDEQADEIFKSLELQDEKVERASIRINNNETI